MRERERQREREREREREKGGRWKQEEGCYTIECAGINRVSFSFSAGRRGNSSLETNLAL